MNPNKGEESYSLSDVALVIRYCKQRMVLYTIAGFVAGVLVTEALILGSWLR
jgi:hypothetical protein